MCTVSLTEGAASVFANSRHQDIVCPGLSAGRDGAGGIFDPVGACGTGEIRPLFSGDRDSYFAWSLVHNRGGSSAETTLRHVAA